MVKFVCMTGMIGNWLSLLQLIFVNRLRMQTGANRTLPFGRVGCAIVAFIWASTKSNFGPGDGTQPCPGQSGRQDGY
jgi:hypothetical protein